VAVAGNEADAKGLGRILSSMPLLETRSRLINRRGSHATEYLWRRTQKSSSERAEKYK